MTRCALYLPEAVFKGLVINEQLPRGTLMFALRLTVRVDKATFAYNAKSSNSTPQ